MQVPPGGPPLPDGISAQKNPSLVSVIVVNWNRKDLLRACLASLALQREQAFEVIVVDNGSSDGSADLVKAEFGARHFPVRVVRNAENRGFCAANNQGIALARGEWVALLNNDAEAGPGWLDALVRALSSRPDYGMAASKIVVWEEPGRIDKAGHQIFFDGQNRGRGSGEPDRGQFDREEDTAWPDGCAALYRKCLLDQLGGFDEDFFAYADDAELGLRARIAGWKCIYVPTAVVRHHRGATMGQLSLRRLELIERNRVYLAFKLFPWSLLWLNAAFYSVRLAAGVWSAATGVGEVSRFPGLSGKWQVVKALMRADWEALRGLPRMIAKRRRLSLIRRLSWIEFHRLLWRFRIPLRDLGR